MFTIVTRRLISRQWA